MKMKKYLLLFIAVMFLNITNIQANVFASAVEISYSGSFPATISYSLNQNATSVVINIKDASGAIIKVINIAGGANGALLGFNDVDWDGTLDAGGSAASGLFSIEIEANDNVGTDSLANIAYETVPDSWYWSGSGVAVNRNQASPFFGTTYIAERTGKLGHDNGSKPRGLYIHDSQGRYFGQSQASAYASGNNEVVEWDSLAGYEGSPWGITVGPDDRTYAFVLSSNGKSIRDGGLAVGDALFSAGSISTILPFSGDAISDAIVVGLGADRVLYTVEQTSERTGSDNDSPDDGDGFDAAHIMMYAIGESDGDASGTGVEVIPTSTLSHPFRIELDSEGFLYVVQTAYDSLAVANNIYALSKWNISGAAPVEVWHIGLNDAPEHADSLTNVHNARATNFNGLAIDEVNGRLWTTRKNNSSAHNIMAYNMSTGALEESFGDGGWSIRDVNVDAAGNVLIISSSYERFRIFSPNGPNSYTTVSPSKIDVTNGVVGVEENSSEIPNEYALEQNYPNPFNPTTLINFSLPESGLVTLKVFNILGQEVVELVNDIKAAGSYNVSLDASDLTTGLYIYTIQAGNFTATKKMMLVK